MAVDKWATAPELKVVPISAPQSDPKIVAALEDLLARAKAGELVAFTAAYVDPEGVPATMLVMGPWPHAINSATTLLSHQVIGSILVNASKVD